MILYVHTYIFILAFMIIYLIQPLYHYKSISNIDVHFTILYIYILVYICILHMHIYYNYIHYICAAYILILIYWMIAYFRARFENANILISSSILLILFDSRDVFHSFDVHVCMYDCVKKKILQIWWLYATKFTYTFFQVLYFVVPSSIYKNWA